MTDRREFHDLATPAEARAAIASFEPALEPEHVPLDDAAGRVLAARIDAGIDVPGFDRASMDGYAVRASDTFGADEANPVRLELGGAVHAGARPTVTVEPGTVAEISTGAVLPPGADAVVMVERTDEVADGIEIRTAVAPGDHVMLAGADLAAGQRALGPGTVLTAREVGLLAGLGLETVPVRARPRVGIVSTGDELVRPGELIDPAAGQIYDVNSYAIATAVEEAGGECVRYPHTGDDFEEMERVLLQAADECDLVLSSGSTSASAVDVVYRVIEDRGELLIHGVAVKPGKPLLIGQLGSAFYVGLPGYPVSALMVFRAFVAPAIRRAAGLPERETATVDATMAAQERYEEGRTRLLPVGLLADATGETLAYPVDKGSGATTSLVDADGVIEVDADTAYLAAGEPVTVQLFSPDVRPPTVLVVGEDDPALSQLLDRLERPRFLPVATREGVRRLGRGIPDVAVTAGPLDREVDGSELGGWRREWGLVVPAGNPDDVTGVADLVDHDLQFVNRTADSGLRRSLERELDALATERGASRAELTDAIAGFARAGRAYESPPQKVAGGDADVGLGLRVTADRLGLGFVSLGEEVVRLWANPERTETPGVEELRATLDADLDAVIDGLSGYRRG